MDYRFPKGGKRRVIVFGSFPAMSLSAARNAKLKAKLLLTEGKDPAAEKQQLIEAQRQVEERKQAERQHTFRNVAKEWYDEEIQAKPKSESWKCNVTRWISWANVAVNAGLRSAPAFIQSNFGKDIGKNGNFEVLVRQGNQLCHWWRRNTESQIPLERDTDGMLRRERGICPRFDPKQLR